MPDAAVVDPLVGIHTCLLGFRQQPDAAVDGARRDHILLAIGIEPLQAISVVEPVELVRILFQSGPARPGHLAHQPLAGLIFLFGQAERAGNAAERSGQGKGRGRRLKTRMSLRIGINGQP